MIRVLIAEDSAVTRQYLLHLIEREPSMEVVSTARDGAEAVDQIAHLRPDVVLMDIQMPRMNGYEATRQIMEQTPTPVVLTTATMSRRDVAMTFEALDAGALTVVHKPSGLDDPDENESVRHLIDAIRLMSEIRVVHRWPRTAAAAVASEPAQPSEPISAQRRSAPALRVIAIGSSTGGPGTLTEVLGQLRGALRVPVLLAQHIAPGFGAGLAEWLARSTGLSAKVAEHGEPALDGTIYVATDTANLGIQASGRIILDHRGSDEGFYPSASYLFQSVARAYGEASLGILLTGMGRDGATGLLAMRKVGAVTVAQDKETSVVFGMPGEAVRIGAAMHVLPPIEIGRLARRLIAGSPESPATPKDRAAPQQPATSQGGAR